MTTQITLHFTREELTCRCGCGRMDIPPALIQRLENLRVKAGFPLKISSGFRCPEYNQKVSATGLDGPHTKGAVDIAIIGEKALSIILLAKEAGFTGIGVAQKGDHGGRFIHVDDLPNDNGQPRPWIWSY